MYGCRISKETDSQEIKLFNNGRGGDYLPLENDEVEIFLEKG